MTVDRVQVSSSGQAQLWLNKTWAKSHCATGSSQPFDFIRAGGET
jgi:hypothetical protein